MEFYSKSIEQLENDYWKELSNYPSGLVKNCYDYRKIPLFELTIEQLRTLISQNIGTEYLIDLVFEKLESNVLTEGDFYQGDLLISTSLIDEKFWKIHLTKLNRFEKIVKQNSEFIILEMGEKKFDELTDKIKELASA